MFERFLYLRKLFLDCCLRMISGISAFILKEKENDLMRSKVYFWCPALAYT